MTAKPRLLLVEDVPSVQRLYRVVLGRLDIELSAAETGALALAALRETAFAVVLLDLDLPDMSGVEVLRALRGAGASCTVIVVTAHGAIDVAVEAMREGADDFITKPFAPDRLLATVRDALSRAGRNARTPALDITALDVAGTGGDPPSRAAIKPLWQVEREAIEAALAACGGNVPRAAALLEVNPSTIYRRKAEWEKARLAAPV